MDGWLGTGHYALPMSKLIEQMAAVCARHGAPYVETSLDAMAGVARNVGSGLLPLNGLRHRRGTTSGWFIWAGDELSEDDDFFEPTHLHHLIDRCPEVLPMLGLGEGWRFLVAPDYEDVWFDPSLLDESV